MDGIIGDEQLEENEKKIVISVCIDFLLDRLSFLESGVVVLAVVFLGI